MPRTVIKEQHRKPPGYKPGIIGGISSRYVSPTTIRTDSLDFSFLGLNPANPRKRRDENQDAEDLFCQRLLWLDAAWFDSLARWSFVVNDFDDDEDSLEKVGDKDEPDLTLMERRWVSVGWPSEGRGCWVAEYDAAVRFLLEPRNQPPPNAACVHLARTMEEKCEMLKSIGAKHYKSIREYEGVVCVNAWEKKITGEFGPSVKH
ncbi:hypothetical protein LQW54_011372 [Pestalotiopsis sp. IQ-011]